MTQNDPIYFWFILGHFYRYLSVHMTQNDPMNQNDPVIFMTQNDPWNFMTQNDLKRQLKASEFPIDPIGIQTIQSNAVKFCVNGFGQQSRATTYFK